MHILFFNLLVPFLSLSANEWPCHLQIQRWNKIGSVSYFYHWFHHLTCICTHPQCLFSVHNVPAILSFLYWGHVQFHLHIRYFSSVQSLSSVQLFAIPWTAAWQASLPITNSWSLLKLMSIELVILSITSSSVFPFSSCLQSFPESGSFPRSQFFASGGQSAGASAPILPMNIQELFPLGWTGWISLQFRGLSRVFSNTTVQKHQFFCAQLSL